MLDALTRATRCASRIYNIVDDDPAPRSEVAAFADALLAGTEPPAAAAAAASAAASEGDAAPRLGLDEKRVRNERIKRELRVALRFPDYRAGLRALHASERTPF